MNRLIKLVIFAGLVSSMPVWAQAAAKTASAPITAEEILQENSAARGGVAAWHAVDSFTIAGRIDTGGSQIQPLSFLLDVKQPGKARIELQSQGQRAVHVFDGNTAWKIASFLQKYDEEPNGPQASNVGARGLDLGGPFLDYGAQGVVAELEGTEKIEGHNAYRLKLTMKDGGIRHMWVDADTFLELKVEANPRVLNGRFHSVTVYYRDYKPVQGLMIPHLFETVVEGLPKTEKVTIDAVAVNPKLDDNLFGPE